MSSNLQSLSDAELANELVEAVTIVSTCIFSSDDADRAVAVVNEAARRFRSTPLDTANDLRATIADLEQRLAHTEERLATALRISMAHKKMG